MPEISTAPDIARPVTPDGSQPPTHPMPDSAPTNGLLGRLGRGLGLIQEPHQPQSSVQENPVMHGSDLAESTDKKPGVAQSLSGELGAASPVTTDPKGEIPPTVHMGVLQGGRENTGLGVDPATALHPDTSEKPSIPEAKFADNKTFATGAEPEKPKSNGADAIAAIPTRVPGVEKPYEPAKGAWDDIRGIHPDLMAKDKGNGVVEVPTARMVSVDTSGRFGVLQPKDAAAEKALKEKYGVFPMKQTPEGKWVQITPEEMAQARAKAVKDVVKKTKYGITIVAIAGGVALAPAPGEGVHPQAPFVPMPEDHSGQMVEAPVAPVIDAVPQNPGAVGGEGSGKTEAKPIEAGSITEYHWNDGDPRNVPGFLDAQIALALTPEDQIKEKFKLTDQEIQDMKDGKPVYLNLGDADVNFNVAKTLQPYKEEAIDGKLNEGYKQNHDAYLGVAGMLRAKVTELNGAEVFTPGNPDEFSKADVKFLPAEKVREQVGKDMLAANQSAKGVS